MEMTRIDFAGALEVRLGGIRIATLNLAADIEGRAARQKKGKR